MVWFKKKKEHELEARKLKADIDNNFKKATKSVKSVKNTLEVNGFILELRKGLGNKHV